MTQKRIPAETFPVGEFIAEELEARFWSHADLAARTGLSPDEVTAIIEGKRQLLCRDAEALGRAFGTSAELWLRLQRSGQPIKPKRKRAGR